MYKFLTKYGQTFAFVLGIAVVGIFLLMATMGQEKFNALPDEQKSTTGIFDFGLYGAIALAILCIVAMFGFGLAQVFSNLKGSVKGLIGVAGLVVVYFVGGALAGPDSAHVAKSVQDAGITAGQNAFINGGIMLALFLAIGATAAFAFSEIRAFFK